MLDEGEESNTPPGYFGQWRALAVVEEEEDDDLSLDDIEKELEKLDEKLEGIHMEAKSIDVEIQRTIESLQSTEAQKVNYKTRSR